MPADPFRDDMTLGEARARLRELVYEGHECPCCRQFAKVYRRKIHAMMAVELVRFYRFAGSEWGYLPDSGVQRGGDMVKCRYWGLIKEDTGTREDGSSRTGWWRVTMRGRRFIFGKDSVPKYAHIYNGRRLSLLGDPITIHDALGKRFDYGELMEGL